MPAAVQLSTAPDVYTVADFAGPEQIEQLLAVAGDWDRIAAEQILTEHDVTGFCYELPVRWAPALAELADRIERLTGLVNQLGETFRFRRYARGELHPAHTDGYQIEGAHLLATAMLCLEAPQLGGATRFCETGLELRPEVGRLLLWYNFLPDGSEDPQSLHESLPVLRGIKTTLTCFVYGPLELAGSRPESC